MSRCIFSGVKVLLLMEISLTCDGRRLICRFSMLNGLLSDLAIGREVGRLAGACELVESRSEPMMTFERPLFCCRRSLPSVLFSGFLSSVAVAEPAEEVTRDELCSVISEIVDKLTIGDSTMLSGVSG